MLNINIYLLKGFTRTRIFNIYVINSLAALLRSAIIFNNICRNVLTCMAVGGMHGSGRHAWQ
jgi:hypothetical protein